MEQPLSGVSLHQFEQDQKLRQLGEAVDSSEVSISELREALDAASAIQDQINTLMLAQLTELKRIRIGIAHLTGLELESMETDE